MGEQENEALVRKIYDDFSQQNVPEVLAVLDPDIEWSEAEGLPWGGFQKGIDAVVSGVFGPTITLVPDFTVTPEQIVAKGDEVAVIHRYTGTGKATGAKLDVVGSAWWTVRDGKIVRFRQFVDTVKFTQAVPADVPTEA
jgi:ketosteroid isomerase-like protein